MSVARNSAAITFGPPTANWLAPTHGGVWTAETGGMLIGWSPLTTAVAVPQTGASVTIPIGSVSVTIPHSGEFTEDGADRAITGWLTGSTYASLHSAAPTDTGANELSGNGYARQQITWGAPTAS